MKNESVMLGVFSSLGNSLRIDATILRFIFIICLMSDIEFPFFWTYVILGLFIGEE